MSPRDLLFSFVPEKEGHWRVVDRQYIDELARHPSEELARELSVHVRHEVVRFPLQHGQDQS